MTIDELIGSLLAKGVRLELDADGQIEFSGPEDVIDGDAFRALAGRRDEVVAFLADRQRSERLPPIARVERGHSFPASLNQQELLDELCDSEPLIKDRMMMTTEISGELDPETLRAALDRVCLRHEVLRTTFEKQDGVWHQRISNAPKVSFEAIDLSEFGSEHMLEIDKLRHFLWSRELSLQDGPLIFVLHASISDNTSILIVMAHHAIIDAFSWGIFYRELTSAYDAVASSVPPDGAGDELQYVDFAVWQRERLPAADKQWRDLREAKTVLALAPPGERRGTPTRMIRVPFYFSSTTDLRLAKFCRDCRITPTILVSGVIAILLSRCLGVAGGSYGMITNGRVPGTEGMIGAFAQIRPFAMDFTDCRSLVDLATLARPAFIRAQDARLRASREFLKETGIGRSRVNLTTRSEPVRAAAGISASQDELSVGPVAGLSDEEFVSHCDLLISASVSPYDVSGGLAYPESGGETALSSAQWFSRAFRELLDGGLSAPEKPLRPHLSLM